MTSLRTMSQCRASEWDFHHRRDNTITEYDPPTVTSTQDQICNDHPIDYIALKQSMSVAVQLTGKLLAAALVIMAIVAANVQYVHHLVALFICSTTDLTTQTTFSMIQRSRFISNHHTHHSMSLGAYQASQPSFQNTSPAIHTDA